MFFCSFSFCHYIYFRLQKPFEHESLLIDKKELRLTKKEKRLAQQSYVMEKRLNVSYSRPSYAAFYPKGQEGNARQIKIVSPPSQPIWYVSKVKIRLFVPLHRLTWFFSLTSSFFILKVTFQHILSRIHKFLFLQNFKLFALIINFYYFLYIQQRSL